MNEIAEFLTKIPLEVVSEAQNRQKASLSLIMKIATENKPSLTLKKYSNFAKNLVS
jgi:hypothetical protein